MIKVLIIIFRQKRSAKDESSEKYCYTLKETYYHCQRLIILNSFKKSNLKLIQLKLFS